MTDETPRCTIVGCDRNSVSSVHISIENHNEIPIDLSLESMKSSDGTIVVDTCLPCRRALSYGRSISDKPIIDEWSRKEEKDKFKRNSCSIHRKPNTN